MAFCLYSLWLLHLDTEAYAFFVFSCLRSCITLSRCRVPSSATQLTGWVKIRVCLCWPDRNPLAGNCLFKKGEKKTFNKYINQFCKMIPPCQWYCKVWFCDVNDNAEILLHTRISPQNQNHMKKYVCPDGLESGKNDGQKNCDTVPLLHESDLPFLDTRTRRVAHSLTKVFILLI